MNPFFKTLPKGDLSHYGAKWWESEFTDENTFPQLHDAPMVPKDLRCLRGCFHKYTGKLDLLSAVQEICSRIGLDRQVATHTKEGYDLVQSNFSDLSNWCELPYLPLNPNLDCLVYFEIKERNGCRSENDGVCNFIPDQSGKRQSDSDTQRLDDDIETEITYPYDYRYNHLRAFDPVTRAIGICALAKVIQFHQVGEYEGSDFTTPEAVNLFSGDSPSTCDHFMPDIFGSLCSCVGTCAIRNFDPTSDADPNLILHFHTDRGLWGCQEACEQTTIPRCEFYTHSKLTYDYEEEGKFAEIPGYPVFHCFLWKKCDNFFIPGQTEWLDLRSGPRDCALYTQLCPIVREQNTTAALLPPGYTEIPCSETTSLPCGFEVREERIFCHTFCKIIKISHKS